MLVLMAAERDSKEADFKKSTYLNLVKYETEDQIAAAKEMSPSRAYIDADHIGIWGWSFGGHMSTNALLKGNDVFSTWQLQLLP